MFWHLFGTYYSGLDFFKVTLSIIFAIKLFLKIYFDCILKILHGFELHIPVGKMNRYNNKTKENARIKHSKK